MEMYRGEVKSQLTIEGREKLEVGTLTRVLDDDRYEKDTAD